MMYGFGAMGFLGPLMMLLLWGGLIVLAVWAVRGFGRHQLTSGGESALEILKRRLASGEITEAEFQQTRKSLGV